MKKLMAMTLLKDIGNPLIRHPNMAAGLLFVFPNLAAKNTFRIAGKDFRIAGKEDMTLI